jgi:hypothetical protein
MANSAAALRAAVDSGVDDDRSRIERPDRSGKVIEQYQPF